MPRPDESGPPAAPRPTNAPVLEKVEVSPDKVVERALAILEQDSRDWAERRKRLSPDPTLPEPGADHEL